LGAWYSVTNSTGSSFAKSQYSLSTSNFNLTTSTFNNAGTYQLNITADKLTGCSQGSIQATVVVNNIITPVHFIGVTAERINGSVNVSWRVENEADVVDYNVQVSNNGVDFSDIGTVNYKHGNSGTNTYSFDYRPDAKNALYFRIKQNDVDGNYMLSKIVAVTGIKDPISRISPNPSSGRFVLSQVSNSEQLAEIAVRSLEGKIVLRKTIVLRPGLNESTILLSKVFPGIYYLSVSGKDLSAVHKLIITGN
jgi:hypothetical protein